MIINTKITGMDKLLGQLNPKVFELSLNRTINDLGRKTTTVMSKNVREQYNIKAKILRKYIKVSKSRYGHFEYKIDISSKSRNVTHFSSKVLKKKGHVSVRIKKGEGRKVLIPAFKAKNSDAILTRVDKTQEIKAVQTLSIPQMFNSKTKLKAEELNEQEFGSTFKRNFDYYISKK